MTRVLVGTDRHIGDTAKNRIDDYLQAGIDELDESLTIAVALKCDAFVDGGDVFNVPEPSGTCRNSVLKTLSKPEYASLTKYCMIGNHDVKHNLVGIHNSALGTMFDAGVLEHVNVLPHLGIALHDYRDTLSQEIRDGLFTKSSMPIQIAHASIVINPCYGDYVLIREIDMHPNAQLLISGHIHNPMRGKTKGGVKFVNPGAIGRHKLDAESMARIPQVLLLEYELDDIENIKITPIPLKSSRPSDEIFNTEEANMQKAEKADTMQFIQRVSQVTEWWTVEVDRAESLRQAGLAKQIPLDVIETAIAAVEEVNVNKAKQA